MYTAVFKLGHAPEQYPTMKFRVRQSVRWLEHIPYLLVPNVVINAEMHFFELI